MKTSLKRQIRVSIPVALYSYVTAFHYPWTTANLSYFRSTTNGLSFSDNEISFITSIMHVGRLCAPIICIILPIEFGRKTHFVVSALLFLIGTLLFLTCSTIEAISVARFIIGFGLGIGDISVAMYTSETVSKKIRGVFISATVVLFCVGIQCTYILATFFNYDNILLILLALTAVFFLCSFDLIESPYFLLAHGQSEKALNNLKWLNDYTLKDAEEEIKIISNHTEKMMTFLDLIRNFNKPEIYKSCCIVCSMGIILTLLGTITNCFANLVFPSMGSVSPNEFAIGFTSLITLMTCGSSIIIDKYGRRALLVPGFALQTIAHATIALLYYLQDKKFTEFPNFAWIIFGFITVTFLLCQFSCMVPYTVVRGEIFPSNFKSIAVSGNIILNSLTNTIFSYFFLPIMNNYGIYLNFIIFSFASLTGLLIIYFMLPETKGKSLIEIQLTLQKREMFNHSVKEQLPG